MLLGTVLGSQGPEQKSPSEGSRLSWISTTAVGQKKGDKVSGLVGTLVAPEPLQASYSDSLLFVLAPPRPFSQMGKQKIWPV